MALVPSQGGGEAVGGVQERGAWLGELLLLGRIGRSCWLAAAENGLEVVARRVALPDLDWPAAPAEVLSAAAPVLEVASHRLLPVVGFGTHGGRLWMASFFDRGVALRRVLETVRLSPAQALLLGADVLEAMVDLHEAGRWHPRLHAGNVQVGCDGLARLSDWALPVGGAGALDEARCAGAVLGALAAACGSPASEGTEELALLLELEDGLRMAREDVALHLQAFAVKAEEAAGDRMRRFELRAELVALVGAVAGRPEPAPPAPVPVLPREAAAAQTEPWPRVLAFVPPTQAALEEAELTQTGQGRHGSAPAGRRGRAGTSYTRAGPGRAGTGSSAQDRSGAAQGSADPAVAVRSGAGSPLPQPKGVLEQLAATLGDRRVRRSLWGLVLAVAVLGAVLGAEVAFLHGPITSDLRVLKGSSRTAASKVAADTGPAPVLAPPSAGVIRVVDLRALTPCSAGGSCELTVVVGTRQVTRPLRVAWQLEALDRCRRARVSLGRGAMTVPAGQREAVGLKATSLPRWPLLALVALTTSPARAASAPLPVPASGGSC